MSRPLRLALVINPVAGIGGAAGLAGSDGEAIQRLAAARGFRSQAVERALERAVDLIVFVGGDGTARDVLDAVEAAGGTAAGLTTCAAAGAAGRTAVLGIPSGVKMHSAVFARSPATAAALVEGWDPAGDGTRPGDVADIDEAARRAGTVSARLYGVLPVPDRPLQLQGGKIGTAGPTAGSHWGLARELQLELDPAKAWIFGPGSTVRGAAAELDADYGLGDLSLLGVDVSVPGAGRRRLWRDCDARTLERLVAEQAVQLVLSPIGGQGFLLGRGNQQLRPELLERLAPADFIVIATPAKLGELRGGPLYIDSGSDRVDRRFAGYLRVHTGPHETAMVRIMAA
jgi:predicted polyphosphate/ATP-dependent NAD kinase